MSEPEALSNIMGRILSRPVWTAESDGPESEAPPSCAQCGDLGFVYPRLPLDHPAFGKRVLCECRKGRFAEIRERHWRNCGFGARHLVCRLETHPIALECAMPALMTELMNPNGVETRTGWVDGWQRSWMLYGERGHGKTGLAAGYAYRFFFEHGGESVYFRDVPELLDELRATYNPRQESGDGKEQETEASLMHTYRTCGLLLLDDLGTEQLNVKSDGSSWALERLFRIVNARYIANAPVFITSNLNPVELKRRMETETGQRIMDRIIESCAGRDHIVEVRHRNLRYS